MFEDVGEIMVVYVDDRVPSIFCEKRFCTRISLNLWIFYVNETLAALSLKSCIRGNVLFSQCLLTGYIIFIKAFELIKLDKHS